MYVFVPNDPLALAVFVAFAAVLLIQLIYLVSSFSGPGFRKSVAQSPSVLPPVSVVVCARNELKNLRQFLPLVLDQDYPEYQVVVVNDCSWDESGKYLEELARSCAHLKVVTLAEQEKYQHGKKFAVSIGIKAAAFEHLVFTDADCQPAGRHWLRKMAAGFSDEKSLVIAYGAYFRAPGFLNRWIRFETAWNALIFLTRAMRGKAYMGVGRNLAYTKTLFFKNKGFANHYHILSGDDDLFVNEVSDRRNTAVVIDSEAFTYSKPKTSLIGWIRQKTRHLSAGKLYRSRDKRLLIGWQITHFLFWTLLLATFLVKLNPEIAVTGFTLRLFTLMIITWKGFKKLGEADLILLTPLFDFLAVLLYPVLTVTGLFYRNQHWK
jgi:cellulose synthase/poly-beta-1,6-N-acetylglucosamine synthase-like glycosyltransferase